ncbi:MAG: hypothetical protein LIQ30_01860, partial [Planctomycetes bacterium]|nr:hypothetical protein [Planctomycetota bacterium]
DYQKSVNKSVNKGTSNTVIASYQDASKNGEDYRYEEAPNPVPELQDRTKDNTDLGRKAPRRNSNRERQTIYQPLKESMKEEVR